MTEIKTPKLFVSYSWTTPEYEDWILNLATELRESGVDVILDKWDLKEGDDANAFMERMVTDESVDKVLIVCDRKYAEKADRRSGGVGTETQIISAKVYESVEQSKFVLVVAERDDKGKAYLPTYYTGRIYIDLCDDDNYSKNFEQLIRWVYDKPLHIKPKLGNRPVFLTEGDTLSLETNVVFRRAIDAVKNGKNYADGAVAEYFQTYASNLENFRLQSNMTKQDLDDLIVENIDLFIPYRNQFIELLNVLAKYREVEFVGDQIHNFFESTIPYLYSERGFNNYRDWEYDNYRFILEELFLYSLAVLLMHEKFISASFLILLDYYNEILYQELREKQQDFNIFQNYLDSLEYRNKNKSETKWLSLHANILKERCTGISVKFHHVQQADFILFLLSSKNCIEKNNLTYYSRWHPKTLIYTDSYRGSFEIFRKAESKRYFDKLKCIFNVDKKEELSPIFEAFKERNLTVPQWGFNSIHPSYLANFDNLCTKA